MRLIDADALVQLLDEYDQQLMIGWVEDAPTIDAVPVVRCWECIYNTDDGYHECIEFGIRIPDDAEFFCKYGKRRGELFK